ncbi:MATE family efflux transporter [Pillotina sp. SPG140]
MTTAPIERLVITMAIPSMCIMLVSAFYNMADTYFVGSLGTSQTAAVGISFSLMAVIQAVGFFFGQGAGNYISRALGAQHTDDAERMASTGFFTAFGIGIIIAVFGNIFLEPLVRALGATTTIIPFAIEYIRYILLAAPFMIGSFTLNNLLRFQGNASFATVGMISGAILNVGLDPLFIFVLDMGVRGAAFATMISQMLSCGILFSIISIRKETVRIKLFQCAPTFRLYKEIIRGGAPSLVRQVFMSIATIILNHAAGAFGDYVIAAVSIVNRITLIAGSALIGLGQGFQPVCGFNYGAKLYSRVKQAFWFCVRTSAIILTIFAIFAFKYAPQIIALFRKDDPEVILIAARALRFQCFVLPLGSWIVLNNMLLQTIGKAVPASILAFARQGLFLIPLIFILTPFLNVLAIQLVTPLSDFLTFLMSIPLTVPVFQELSKN